MRSPSFRARSPVGKLHPMTSLPNWSHNDAFGSSTSKSFPLRILTHNIRYATTSPFKGELLWSELRSTLFAHLRHNTNSECFTPIHTLICLQEVLHEQLLDIHQSLDTKEWLYVGRGRDDGEEKGEYSPIFFRQDRWTLVHNETIWLNPENKVGEKGWDAASVRILTVAVLQSRTSDTSQSDQSPFVSAENHLHKREKLILAMNTHLDDQGLVSRRESAKMILGLAHDFEKRWHFDLMLLAGDLNSEISGEAYQILNGIDSIFMDARRCVTTNSERVYGNEMTFTGFDGDGDGEGNQRIDFIHLGRVNNEDDCKASTEHVKGYAVLPNKFDDKIYMSDHRAVMVDIEV